jgi:DNA-binding SARP family transcriptional activator
MAATRDEILEVLWPDLSPDTAGNSLHQTIYFLRRVFEPDFREGLSAEYVAYDGEVVSLNPNLFDSTSQLCWRRLSGEADDRSAVESILTEYQGRFAIYFAYEDWASDYRDNLHAAVLAAAESTMSSALRVHDYATAIRLGHALLAIDPEADGVELSLLRAYKASGRSAAAAEQYGHYASFMRDEVGVEPIPFNDI